MRHGYDVKSLADRFQCKPTEIKRLFAGTVDAGHSSEMTQQVLAAGIPL